MGEGSEPESAYAGQRRWLGILAPVALLALFAFLAISSLRGKSVTGDEVAHLPAGYTYLVTGDLRLNPQHPPLIKVLAALPLLGLELRPVDQTPGWTEADEWTFGRHFLTDNRVPLERLIFRARLPMVAVGVLLGAVLFLWAGRVWGPRPALLVLLLHALSPTLLAHTRLVTTDVGVAFATVLTLASLWMFVRTRAWGWAVACGVALGLALLAKYSGLLAALMVPPLLALAVAVTRRDGEASLRPATAAVAGALILGLAAAVVLVGFGFPAGLANWAHGLGRVYADHNPHWEGFLWGRYSATGFRSYYLLAQLWKTPLPALILFALSLGTIRWRDRGRLLDWAFILLPIAAFHAAGVFNRANIGIRHILPVLPFLHLGCGAVASAVLRAPRWARAAGLLLCLWYAWGTLRVHPHYIPYFNELAGGPAGGIRFLDDSNIEWGQDWTLVRRYLEAHPGLEARVFAFEPLPRRSYGIEAADANLRDAVWPQPGVLYLMGASHLRRSSLYDHCPGVRFRWLESYRPLDSLGWSIYVYRFSVDGGEDDGALSLPREQWYSDAVERLQPMVQRCPDFALPRRLLAEVHAHRSAWLAGREPLAAVTDAARATQLDPEEPDHRRLLAELLEAIDRGGLEAAAPSAAASHDLALALIAQDRLGEALPALLALLAREPDHVEARFSLGSLLHRLGLAEAGDLQWRRCLEVDPGYGPARQALATR